VSLRSPTVRSFHRQLGAPHPPKRQTSVLVECSTYQPTGRGLPWRTLALQGCGSFALRVLASIWQREARMPACRGRASGAGGPPAGPWTGHHGPRRVTCTHLRDFAKRSFGARPGPV